MAKSGRHSSWTPEELEQLRSNILPEGKQVGNARVTARKLGLHFHYSTTGKIRRPWTPEEESLLRNGGIPEGRSFMACRMHAMGMGFNLCKYKSGGHGWARWTEEELAQLRAGKVPDGRTLGSTRAYAFQHGISFNLQDTKHRAWSQAEDDMVRQGIHPSGRTIGAMKARARALGVKFCLAGDVHPPRWSLDGRAEAVWTLHDHGFTFVKIGEFFGFTRERARQLNDLYADWQGKSTSDQED